VSGDNTARNADLAFAKCSAHKRTRDHVARRWPVGPSLLGAAIVSIALWAGIFWLAAELI
jgi:hypothetical protein